MSSCQALNRIRNDSSVIRSPWGVSSRIASPLRKHAERVGVAAVPVALGHLAAVGAEPPDVGQARAGGVDALQEPLAAEHGMLAPHGQHPPHEVDLLDLCLAPALPGKPGDLVVLAPRVVAAALAAAELVAAEQHRHALGEQQRRQEVALLARAQRVDLRIVGLALHAAVPRPVVVRAVLVVLEVGLVVLLVVRDEVVQREAVVGGDEVDRRGRPPAVVAVEVARAGEARGEVGDALLAAPEVAHDVAVDAVPLAPQHGELADLVAAGPDVPRLGDQLDLREHGGPGGSCRRTSAGGRRRRGRAPVRWRGRSGSRPRGSGSPSSAASP